MKIGECMGYAGNVLSVRLVRSSYCLFHSCDWTFHCRY